MSKVVTDVLSPKCPYNSSRLVSWLITSGRTPVNWLFSKDLESGVSAMNQLHKNSLPIFASSQIKKRENSQGPNVGEFANLHGNGPRQLVGGKIPVPRSKNLWESEYQNNVNGTDSSRGPGGTRLRRRSRMVVMGEIVRKFQAAFSGLKTEQSFGSI